MSERACRLRACRLAPVALPPSYRPAVCRSACRCLPPAPAACCPPLVCRLPLAPLVAAACRWVPATEQSRGREPPARAAAAPCPPFSKTHCVQPNKQQSAGGVARPASAGQHSRLVVVRVQGAGVRPVPCRRPAWSVVLPGLRNAGEPALVASRGRARARSLSAAPPPEPLGETSP